jgi:hypothetical protein
MLRCRTRSAIVQPPPVLVELQVLDQLSRNEDLVPLLLSLLGRAADARSGSLRASAAAAAAGSMGRSWTADAAGNPPGRAVGTAGGLAALASALDGIARGSGGRRSSTDLYVEGLKQRADQEADHEVVVQMHAAGRSCDGSVMRGFALSDPSPLALLITLR